MFSANFISAPSLILCYSLRIFKFVLIVNKMAQNQNKKYKKTPNQPNKPGGEGKKKKPLEGHWADKLCFIEKGELKLICKVPLWGRQSSEWIQLLLVNRSFGITAWRLNIEILNAD